MEVATYSLEELSKAKEVNVIGFWFCGSNFVRRKLNTGSCQECAHVLVYVHGVSNH